jgi:exopolysaccharide biosynthesis polyprenyl glycosylphosphotransferase
MRRALLGADVVGVTVAFAATELIYGSRGNPDTFDLPAEIALFLPALLIWLFGAKLFGLYEHDEERADHSTVDDLARVFLLATSGAFALTVGLFLSQAADPDEAKLTLLCGLSIASVTLARIGARVASRRHPSYVQNTLVVGAGDVGQHVALKLLLHREYGLNVLGFVDAKPKARRADLGGVTVLGTLDDLPNLVYDLEVDRVVFSFSNEPDLRLRSHIRRLRDAGVQVDLVPRLFETMGPNIGIHTIEGVPVIGLPPVRIPRTSLQLKRAIDVVGALAALILASPLLLSIALAVKLDSPGPVLFRQRRLGRNMREFTLLKFRTMRTGVDDAAHRGYIAATMRRSATVGANGLYKLERAGEVTRVGAWLRKTSLDELPQLLNVLKCDMSLVGPRPCLRYELEHFESHHFDRFDVPAGLTGLWQVRARAYSTFGEALDLDVLYAHSWSLGLDISLLARTPLQLARLGRTA